MKMKKSMTVKVDYENNSEIFWEALRAHSELSRLPIADYADECEITPKQFALIQALPGWNDPDAPEYAPHPLTKIAATK